MLRTFTVTMELSLFNCVVSTMLLNWCCSLNIFNAEKSVGCHVKKSITLSFFNKITFYLAASRGTFKKIRP